MKSGTLQKGVKRVKPLKVWTLEDTQAWKDREWVKRRPQVWWRGSRKSRSVAP